MKNKNKAQLSFELAALLGSAEAEINSFSLDSRKQAAPTPPTVPAANAEIASILERSGEVHARLNATAPQRACCVEGCTGSRYCSSVLARIENGRPVLVPLCEAHAGTPLCDVKLKAEYRDPTQ